MSEPEILPRFDEVELGQLILDHDANIGLIAKELKVSSAELRKFIADSAKLTAAVEEVAALAVDGAYSVLWEGLRDRDSFQNRFYSAKALLNTAAGRKRGFGLNEPSAEAQIEMRRDSEGTKTIVLRWLEEAKPEAKEKGAGE